MKHIFNAIPLKTIDQGGLIFNFLETGDVYDITYQDAQINLIHGNLIDGGYFNVYLRIFDQSGIRYTPLIGKHSPSSFSIEKNQVLFTGSFHDVHYRVHVMVEGFRFDIKVNLKSVTPQVVDLMFGSDIAITSKGSVLNSEPYTVQYIDYKVFNHDMGYTLCARQNQGRSQFIQIGSFDKTIGYTTDGFQFFGLQAKETGIPQAMLEERLASEIYQYEFAYFALQSDKLHVNSLGISQTFYGAYEPQEHDVIQKPKTITPLSIEPITVHQQAVSIKQGMLNPKIRINGRNLTEEEWKRLFPNRDQEERKDGDILSFFTNNHHHVVAKKKELIVERQHGHLMVHGDVEHVSDNVMATTNWMFGVFHSHVVAGNSSFNKLLGDLRNPLNLQTISGLRIYIKRQGHYALLGLPSYYEMGGATTRWVYLLGSHKIQVDTFVHPHHLQQGLSFSSDDPTIEDVLIVQQVLMNVNEHLADIPYQASSCDMIYFAPKGSMMDHQYPTLKYRYVFDQPYVLVNQQEAFGVSTEQGMQVISINHPSSFNITIQATYQEAFDQVITVDVKEADTLGTKHIQSFTNFMTLEHPIHQTEMNLLMHTMFWYTHNALVHYASPHGLEQYNGAAWGTRDVCQGPFEFFMANQKYLIAREILTKVYGRQFIENGDFPQWFMFDRYFQIQAHESHGDIIVWPLRALAYYLKATHDLSIMDVEIPYMSIKQNNFVKGETLYGHIKKQINTIIQSFIPGTYLPRYGGGDWDDTLQPANHDLTNKMVSGWTVALLYEALRTFSDEIMSYDEEYAKELRILIQKIKDDYQKHMIVDGIPAGFVVFDEEKTYLLHPRDQKTGLKYRLLPLTRSIIAEFVQPKDVAVYLSVIQKHLKHPDGVRLMDTTVEYKGGIKTYFTRAETAANFGREIGLQYVHAHIRYIEAMAKIGFADEAYDALLRVNPILLQNRVKNAYYRQSNMYFSSSDAWFKDRYEARRDFDRIKKGDIVVKGGWRLYSSGPGIYLAQWISHILGIQRYHGQLMLDPVLPVHLQDLVVSYQQDGQSYRICYLQGRDQLLVNGIPATYQSKFNLYKKPSMLIDNHDLELSPKIDLTIIQKWLFEKLEGKSLNDI